MQDLVSLFNQSLSAVGHAADVTDPEANTKSANLCRLWYAPSRRAVLSAAFWPSARKMQSLALKSVREPGDDPQDGQAWFGFSAAFELPFDCLRPHYLHDYSRFQLGNIGGQKSLMCNTRVAYLYYTQDLNQPQLWEAELYDAIMLTLAARLNMQKSGKIQITNQLRSDAFSLIRQASAMVANEQDTYSDAVPSFYQNAGYSIPQQTRFYYQPATYNIGAF